MSTVPDAPTAVTPSRSGSSSALVTFSPPENDGGNPITLYTVTADPTEGAAVEAKTATGQNSPIVINGLINGEVYSFSARAQNADGDSDASTAAELAIGAAPSPPLAIAASRENGKSTVTFQEPTDDGGATVTHYTVTAQDTVIANRGGQSATSASSPIEITGLANGDAYIFAVTASNEYGTSEEATSGLVIPGGDDPSTPQAPWPNALSFEVHKRIGTLQLQDELRAAGHQDCLVAMVNDSPFSTEGTLFVIPDSVDEVTVQTLIDAHTFDPNYGTPSYLTAFNEVLRRVNNNPNYELTEGEVQVALKGMMAHFPVNLSG